MYSEGGKHETVNYQLNKSNAKSIQTYQLLFSINKMAILLTRTLHANNLSSTIEKIYKNFICIFLHIKNFKRYESLNDLIL